MEFCRVPGHSCIVLRDACQSFRWLSSIRSYRKQASQTAEIKGFHGVPPAWSTEDWCMVFFRPVVPEAVKSH